MNIEYPDSISETAHVLSLFYCELLEEPSVESDCDFLLAGGTSLTILQLRMKIEREFQIQISQPQIYEHSRLNDLAQLVDNSPKTASPTKALQAQSSKAAIVADDGTFPITSYQADLLKYAKSSPDSPHNSIRLTIEIEGEFDVDCFEVALRAFAKRHTAYTLEVVETPTGSRARCRPDIIPTVRRLEKVELVEEQVYEALNERFDLNRPLTPHVVYANPEKDRHIIGFAIHHMTTDGSTIELLLHELASGYAKLISGQSIDCATLGIDYPGFIEFEQTRTQDGTIEVERNFWKQELAGLQVNGQFASDIGQLGGHSFGRLCSELNPKVLANVDALVRKNKTTPFTVFLAAWTRAISLETGEDEIVVESSVALRDNPEFRGTYGCFWNGLLLRVRSESNASPNWLDAAHRTVQRVQPYRHFPYREVKDLIAAQGLGNVAPRFMCTMHHSHPASVFPIPGANSRTVLVGDNESWSHMQLRVWYQSDAAYTEINFCKDKFSEKQVQAAFKAMIGSIEGMSVEQGCE